MAVLALAGCAHPVLHVWPEPESSQVLVDGLAAGTGPTVLPQPYYGTVEVAVLPPLAVDPRAPRWRAARREVEVDPPVTRWIFPLDLLVEVVTSPWRDDRLRVEIAASSRPSAAEGDASAEAFVRRGEALRIQR